MNKTSAILQLSGFVYGLTSSKSPLLHKYFFVGGYCMRITLHIFTIMMVGLFYTACKTSSEQTLCKLTISLDTSLHDNLIYDTELLGNNFKSNKYWTFDTITQTKMYQWDSLKKGEYTFKIQSIFSKEQNLKISLLADTKVKLKNDLNFKNVDLLSKSELIKADTVEFVYTSDGCFHSYIESSILIKNKAQNNYKLRTTSDVMNVEDKPLDIDKIVESKIIEELLQLQLNSKQEKEINKKDNRFYRSTTTEYLYILANNELYQFSSQGLKDWKSYEKFKDKNILQKKK
jgi:hypothetical protein